MFAKGLGLLVRLIGVFWLAIAGAYGAIRYERLPVGWPNYKVGFLFFHATLHAPGAGSVTALASDLATLKAQEAAAARRAAAVTQAQANVSTAVGAQQAAAQAVIVRWRTRFISEIPSVVTPALDRSFPLSVGWVRGHDAAARGVDLSGLPDPAAGADDAPSSVKPSDALAVLAGNYAVCRAALTQDAGWRDWWQREAAAQAVKPAPPKP